MKRKKKYVQALVVSMLILFMVGCQNKKNNTEWRLKGCGVEGLEGVVNEFTMISEVEFYVATGIIGSDESVSEKIYYVNLGEKRAKQIPLSIENGLYATNIVNCGEDAFAAVLTKMDNEGSLKEALIVVDREGKIRIRKDISDIADPLEIINILATKEGRILVITPKCIHELDANLNKEKEYQAPNQIESASIYEDGRVICLYARDEKEGVTKVQVGILDRGQGIWGKEISFKIENNDVGTRLVAGKNDSFFLFSVNGIYKCDEKGKIEILLKYAEQRLGEEAWRYLTVLPNGDFFTCADENGTPVLGYLKLEEAEESITKIVVGGIFMDYSVVRELKQYHQKHPDVLVEIREYECDMSSVTSMIDASNRLNADILSGNGPDIIYLQGLDRRILCDQGLLENLDSYFERDPKISTDDMIPSFREALSVKGSVYYIVPSFTISTLVGKSKLIGNDMGWTMKEAFECWQEHGTDVYAGSGESAFALLIYGLMQNDTVDMADIRMALEMASTEDQGSSYMTEKNARLKDERALLTFGGVTDLGYIQLFHAMFNEESITLKGFPGLSGSGAMFFIDNSLGISSKSSHKDVAWDMIKVFMTKEYQSVKSGNLFYFPTRKDCFEELLRECSKEKSKYNLYLGTEKSNNEDRIIVTALSAEDAERVRQMVYNTKMVYHNSYLFNVATEEAANYFSGNKQLDEVYKIMKERIELYYREGQ